ncbi:ras-related protein Rab-26 [Elephas maximus indicus]|uniref:ras-related protein Rab-26 n=1 Tax=Elephas maximus indicus TaxID=99487 RepID=UPI002116F8AB|nr:ras-related protein Rab-26 [Elephas maximus indicus]
MPVCPGRRPPGARGPVLTPPPPAASALPSANGPRLHARRPSAPAPRRRPAGPSSPAGPHSTAAATSTDIAFKVMLVGDSGVGKTCLLVHFKDRVFLAGIFIATVGINFRNKVLDVDGMKVKIQAWLSEIQEHAQHDTVLMLLGNKVGPACPSCRRARVMARGRGGRRMVLWLRGQGPSCPSRPRPSWHSCLQEYGLPFMETSVKTGLNVDLAFTAIAKELKQHSMMAPSEAHFWLHDYVKREGRGGSCCRPRPGWAQAASGHPKDSG